MSDTKRVLITEQQYKEIRAYEKSAQFDCEKLKAKYRDPFSDYPAEGVTTSIADVCALQR
jgi:hypothetical protein